MIDSTSPTYIYLSCIPGKRNVVITMNQSAKFKIFSLFHFTFLYITNPSINTHAAIVNRRPTL